MSDACSLVTGVATDCDGDGILDSCEVDCDGNGLPDTCELLAPLVEVTSPNLPSIAGLTSVTWTVNDLASAEEPVHVAFTFRHIMTLPFVTLIISLDGTPVKTVTWSGYSYVCSTEFELTTGFFVPADIFNAANADGSVTFAVAASVAYPSCATAYERFALQYHGIDLTLDCDRNGVTDACDSAAGGDCDENGLLDVCELAEGTAPDCNGNGVPDACDIAGAGRFSTDCDENGVPDECDLANGAPDYNENGVPDTCEVDCNENGLPDFVDLALLLSADCDGNLVPDECDIAVGRAADCDADGVPDGCAITDGGALDCNANGVPDDCDIAAGTSRDIDRDGVPDGCQPDCDDDGVPNFIEILFGEPDADANRIPDSCKEPGETPTGDLTGDWIVNSADLAALLGAWGPCIECGADFNLDGTVGAFDLAFLLASWTVTP